MAVLPVAALLAGCGSASTVGAAHTAPAFAVVLSAVDQNQGSLRTLTGEGELHIETPSISQSANFTLVLRKPDSLLLTVTGPFGIRVATALLTPTKFQAYSALQNTLFTGTPSPENLRKALRLNLSYDDLLALFSGGRFLDLDRGAPEEIGVDGADAFYRFGNDTATRRYLVDPASSLLRKVQVLGDRGQLLVEQTFADFHTEGGVTLPHRITLTQPEQRQVLMLLYDNVTPNATEVAFAFSVPSNARRVEWK